MESKDVLTIIGIGATVLMSGIGLIVSIRNSRRLNFINFFLTQKAESQSRFRDCIVDFCSSVFHISTIPMDEKERRRIIEKIDSARFQIRLLLDIESEIDSQIISMVGEIAKASDGKDLKLLMNKNEELVLLVQNKFKQERKFIREGIKD